MNFFFLLALGLAFYDFPRESLAEPVPESIHLLAMAAGILTMIFFARWLSLWTVGQLHRDFRSASKILVRYQWLRRLHSVLGLVVYSLILQWVGWKILVSDHWGLGDWILIDELLILTPYLVIEITSFACFYSVDHAIRLNLQERGRSVRTLWTRGQYVRFHFRSQFCILLLFLVEFIGVLELTSRLLPDWSDFAAIPLWFLLLVLAPLNIRIGLGASPLPSGSERRRLEDLARMLKFRYSNILVWHTNKGIVNAAVTGVIPQLRYVLLSDALLENLEPEEIGSVFGHEVGHIRHHHISYYVFFMGASIVLIALSQDLVHASVSSEVWDWLRTMRKHVPLELLLMVPYFFIAFGFLSRRFERQADLFGSRVASEALALMKTTESAEYSVGNLSPSSIAPEQGTATSSSESSRPQRSSKSPPIDADGVMVFIRALEMVAILNGIPRSLWNWRHGSIAKRVEFLDRVIQDPTLADSYDRWIEKLKRNLALGLAVGIGLLAWLR